MCDLDLDDGEPVQAYKHEERVARKEHRCIVCRARIKPGERYHYTSFVSEGTAESLKECVSCHKDRKKFGGQHDGTPLASDFLCFLQECVAEDDEDAKRWRPMLKRIDARRKAAA